MKPFKITLLFALAAAVLLSLAGCMSFSISSTYDNADKYSAGNAEFSEGISALDIDWSSGTVNVTRHDQNTVSVSEANSADLSEDRRVHTWLDGKTLHIRFCKSGDISFSESTEKKLEVRLPRDLKLDSVSYSCSSADTCFEGIDANDFKADSSSGKLELKDCSAKAFSLDTSSGNILLSQKGEADKITVDTSSGSVEMDLETVKDIKLDSSSGDRRITAGKAEYVTSNTSSGRTELTFGSTPTEIKHESSSGDIILRLPKDAGFKAVVDTSSGKFSSEIPTAMEGDTYTAGSGSCRISADTSSGDIDIRIA